MESEKVKEIKKVLECMSGVCKDDRTFTCYSCVISQNFTPERAFKEALTLVNELESENERLVKELEDMPILFMGCMLENQLLSDITKDKNGEIKALKKRIAELEKENKRLDKVVKNNQDIGNGKLVSKEQLKQFAERLKENLEEYRLENEYFIKDEQNGNLWQLNASVFCIEVTQDGGLVDETLKECLND